MYSHVKHDRSERVPYALAHFPALPSPLAGVPSSALPSGIGTIHITGFPFLILSHSFEKSFSKIRNEKPGFEATIHVYLLYTEWVFRIQCSFCHCQNHSIMV